MYNEPYVLHVTVGQPYCRVVTRPRGVCSHLLPRGRVISRQCGYPTVT